MLRIGLGILVAIAAVAGVIAIILLTEKGAPYTQIVKTSSGPIRGEELTFQGTSYKAFKGIPYAAPPVGGLRFKDPQPPENWTTVRDTRMYGKICHQDRKIWDSSEDCLTLNVFTPSLGENGSKPVLVWIHGGAFYMGDGTDHFYGPQYLIQEDIVVVTLNYRLGPLGFLSTNTPDASGNWGLKDQAAALRWVKENIANFGGDPKKVTIYGESAGSMSVHLHMISPLSRDLFHKVIAASGSALNDWLVTPEQSSKYSINLARILGASETEITDPVTRVQFLRKADPKVMSERAMEVVGKEALTSSLISPSMPFAPVIENAGTPGAFLTEDPTKLFLEGKFNKVPVMMGVTDLEGGLIATVPPEAIREVERNVCSILPEALKSPVVARNECNQVAGEMRHVYFDGKPFNSSKLHFLYMWGDVFLTARVHAAQRIHARVSNKDAPAYNYIFTFDGRWNVVKQMLNVTLPGASHGDDMSYVFKPNAVSLPSLPPESPEVITKNRMVSFIGNFVKNSNPTPSLSDLITVKWEPATRNEAKTMIIGNELKMENGFLTTRMDLWNRLYLKYTGSPLFV